MVDRNLLCAGAPGMIPHPLLNDEMAPVLIHKVGKVMHEVRYFDRDGNLSDPKSRRIDQFIPLPENTDFGALVRHLTALRRWYWSEQQALRARYAAAIYASASGNLGMPEDQE